MKTEQWRWSVGSGWDPGPLGGVLGASAQVAFVFGNLADIAMSAAFATARAAYPTAYLFGCTSAAEIQGLRVTYGTVVVTAVAFEHTRVIGAGAEPLAIDQSFTAGRCLIASLPLDGLRHVFVLAVGSKVNASHLVRGVASALPGGVTVSGGFAGDGGYPHEAYVWQDGDPERSPVVALAFYRKLDQDRTRIERGLGSLWSGSRDYAICGQCSL